MSGRGTFRGSARSHDLRPQFAHTHDRRQPPRSMIGTHRPTAAPSEVAALEDGWRRGADAFGSAHGLFCLQERSEEHRLPRRLVIAVTRLKERPNEPGSVSHFHWCLPGQWGLRQAPTGSQMSSRDSAPAARPTAAVHVGSYQLEFGPPEGTFALFDPQRETTNAGNLAEALATAGHEENQAQLATALDEFVDDASTVTGRCEKIVGLFNDIAAGKALDPKIVLAEIEASLGLLEGLDRDHRHEEAFRLARDLCALLALLLRWLELVRSLELAVRSARAIGNGQDEAWALHELGSLHLAAGEATAAAERLREALRIREELGAVGRCVSRHNLDAAKRDLAELETIARTQRRRRLRLVGGGAAIALLASGGIALGLSTGTSPQKSTFAPPPPATSTHVTTTAHGGSAGNHRPPPPPPTGPTGPTKQTGSTSTRSGSTSTQSTTSADTTAPVLTLAMSPDASFVNTQTPTFSGRAGQAPGDALMVTVRILAADGVLVTSMPSVAPDAAGNYSATLAADTPLAEAQYTATAEQRDKAGNVGHSNSVTFTVDVTKPVLTFTSPKDRSSTSFTTPTFSGVAGTQPGDKPAVSVAIFKTSVPATTVQTLPATSPNGRRIWSVTPTTPLPADEWYTARATQTDQAGNTTSASVTFYVSSPK
jgi:Bacterial Ig-like domain